MNLHQIRYFVAFADIGTVTGASESLGVSQPSLSNGIRELEREVGVALVRRSGRKLVLTNAGSEVVQAMRRTLAGVDDIRLVVKRHGSTPVLRLAGSRALLQAVSPAIKAAMEARPRLQIRTYNVFHQHAVADMLLSGNADIGFGWLTEPHPALIQVPAGSVEQVLASPAGIGLPPVLTFADLDGVPIVRFRSSDCTDAFGDELKAVGATTNLALETDDDLAQMQAVRSGIGSAFVWRPIAAAFQDVEIRTFDPPRIIATAFRHLPSAPPGTLRALEILKAHCPLSASGPPTMLIRTPALDLAS